MLENGNLKHFKLADLINILGQSQKTGELVIESRERHGTLYFSNGVLVNANSSSFAGEEVVYELMACESGEFSFNEKPVNINNIIGKDIHELIKEGSRRVDIISRLSKNSSFGRDPYSVVKLKTSNSSLTDDEKRLSDLLKNASDMTIIKLLEQANFDIGHYVDVLNSLIDKGTINIKKSEEEAFWDSFQKLVNAFYLEFTSISGIKMSKDLDKKIQDLITINTWNLSFKDGKIYTNELFSFPIDEQWKIYKVFLEELLNYFSKIYGSSFIEKVLSTLLGTDPELKTLLEKLNI